MGQAGWRRWGILTVKLGVSAVVLWAIGRHVVRLWHDLARHEATFRLQPGGLLAAASLYLAGLCCCGWFYGLILRRSPAPIAMPAAIRAYLISHLGKYVPGKAMVVVMRAGISVSSGARGATAAFATLYETLVMMASGSILVPVGFALARPMGKAVFAPPWVGRVELPINLLAALAGLALALAFLVVVSPPAFRRLSRLVSVPLPGVGPDALPDLSPGLLARGLCWTGVGWILLGWSQVEVARSLMPTGGPSAIELAPLAIACVALATVAGFVVAVLPGGLLIREGVLMFALEPVLGADAALVAALGLRLVWVAAELLAAVVLLPIGPRARVEGPKGEQKAEGSSPS